MTDKTAEKFQAGQRVYWRRRDLFGVVRGFPEDHQNVYVKLEWPWDPAAPSEEAPIAELSLYPETADTVEAPELMPQSDPGPVPSAAPAPMRRSREQYLAAAEHYLRQALSECDGTEHPAIGDLLRCCMNLIGALAPDPEPHQHKSHAVYPETHSKR